MELPGRDVRVDVWVVHVGRVPVLLLDTDNAANDPADRPITHILYVRGREMRLHQEMVLGIGGVRALSGYILTRQNKWLCFSIIYNHIPGSVSPFEGLQDNACRILVDWPNVDRAKLQPTTRPAATTSTAP